MKGFVLKLKTKTVYLVSRSLQISKAVMIENHWQKEEFIALLSTHFVRVSKKEWTSACNYVARLSKKDADNFVSKKAKELLKTLT